MNEKNKAVSLASTSYQCCENLLQLYTRKRFSLLIFEARCKHSVHFVLALSLTSNVLQFSPWRGKPFTSPRASVLVEVEGPIQQVWCDAVYTYLTDVPDPVDLAMLQAFVVDLLRVRLTWRPPMDNRAPITSYTVTLCHEVNNNNSICTPAGSEMVLPNSTVPTTPGGASDDRIQAIVEHGAGLGNVFLVNISANNRVGDGGFMNGPARVATATMGKVWYCRALLPNFPGMFCFKIA